MYEEIPLLLAATKNRTPCGENGGKCVGSLLTVINQSDALLNGDYSPRVIVKIVLAFLVPYRVSSFSSAKVEVEKEMERECIGNP